MIDLTFPETGGWVDRDCYGLGLWLAFAVLVVLINAEAQHGVFITAARGDGIEGADVGSPDTELALRAERDGGRAGRTYTLTYQAIDDSGNATAALAIVVVPHDEGSGPEPLLMRLERGSAAEAVRLYWPEVPGAAGYDVIAGDLGAWQVRNGRLDLGTVRVLARATPDLILEEPPSTPEPGRAFFYLIRQQVPAGPSGYGTESAPYPRVPGACEGGCP